MTIFQLQGYALRETASLCVDVRLGPTGEGEGIVPGNPFSHITSDRFGPYNEVREHLIYEAEVDAVILFLCPYGELSRSVGVKIAGRLGGQNATTVVRWFTKRGQRLQSVKDQDEQISEVT